ncbi:hypothetical protein [Rhizobium sp. IMFF44]|uniref:hypothetical protein n=1 Tax=unclassified Rhizobium TaxID=2613769 RepID=UPI0035B9749D
MAINRWKLAIVSIVPVFFTLMTWGEQWNLLSKLPEEFEAGRWSYSDEQYAASKGVSLVQLRIDERRIWEKDHADCRSWPGPYVENKCRGLICPSAVGLSDISCTYFPALLKLPSDDFGTVTAGVFRALKSLHSIGISLLLAIVGTLFSVFGLPAFFSRFSRWIQK